MPYRRLVVVGGPGSGKTTVAKHAAGRLGLAHYELDGLWWEPNWTPAESEVFRSRVRQAVAGGSWVLDGNYFDEIALEVWPAADAVIWLDLPRGRCVSRAVARTVRRVVGRGILWNGNQETALNLAPASIWRLFRRWPGYNARISALLEELQPSNVVHLTSAQDIDAWLIGLGRP